MHPVLSLIVGLGLAAIGGELFVKGLVGLAQWARMPASLVGATIAAFATSSPELTVSVNAALAGSPQIALGDALGSNVVNVGLILGLVLLFGAIRDEPGSGLRRDLPWAIGAPILTGALLLDGQMSRVDGGILLFGFIAWMAVAIRSSLANRATEKPEVDRPTALFLSALGLAALIGCGTFIVDGAKWAGGQMGLSTFVTGATLVAIGTSMPELATALISRIRGHGEIGLGTVLGSNLFNGLFIVAVAAFITPFTVRSSEVVLGLGFGLLSVLMVIPGRSGELRRWRGVLLLCAYAASTALLVMSGGS